MNRPSRIDKPKKPTNVSLDSELVEQAKLLGINLSQSCEEGLRKEVSKALSEQWLRENKSALDWSNDYVEKHGLPLAKYRMF
jgi:antitoxin CcdA